MGEQPAPPGPPPTHTHKTLEATHTHKTMESTHTHKTMDGHKGDQALDSGVPTMEENSQPQKEGGQELDKTGPVEAVVYEGQAKTGGG